MYALPVLQYDQQPTHSTTANPTQTFVYTQLNDQTVLFLTIQFTISHLFVKQFYR